MKREYESFKGIPGDGGAHAIDWAILNKEAEWGGTLLQVHHVH